MHQVVATVAETPNPSDEHLSRRPVPRPVAALRAFSNTLELCHSGTDQRWRYSHAESRRVAGIST